MAVFVCIYINKSGMVEGIRKDPGALFEPLDSHALFYFERGKYGNLADCNSNFDGAF